MIIYGYKEKVLPRKNIRQEESKEVVKEMFDMVQEENSGFEEAKAGVANLLHTMRQLYVIRFQMRHKSLVPLYE